MAGDFDCTCVLLACQVSDGERSVGGLGADVTKLVVTALILVELSRHGRFLCACEGACPGRSGVLRRVRHDEKAFRNGGGSGLVNG